MSGNSSGSSGRRGGSRGGGRGKKKAAPKVEPLHPIETPPEIESFRDWKLDPEILAAIDAMGIHKPTPIQALAIGPVLEGRDVIAKAETGTGKTLAFGAPLMSVISPRRASVLGLVLSPTRELAEQVHSVMAELGERRGIKVAFIVGGEPIPPQVEQLRSGAQVVVGTPGRVLDLLRQKFLAFPWTEFAVLDEADKMLEIGFLDDIREILKAVAPEAQKLMFSATFPPDLLTLARQHTTDPVEVATASGYATVDTIAQCYFEVDEDQGFRNLAKILEKSGDDDTFIVFCPRRTDVNRLMRRMERKRHAVKALHGGYEQEARFAVMEAFRRGDVKALIATDVASRGLDIDHVTHVVNFGSPRDPADYTHRIGRTGRAGREGTAITFVFPHERRNWSYICRGVNWEIPKIEDPSELKKVQDRWRRSVAGEDEATDEGSGSTDDSSADERAPGRDGGAGSSEGRPPERRDEGGSGGDREGRPKRKRRRSRSGRGSGGADRSDRERGDGGGDREHGDGGGEARPAGREGGGDGGAEAEAPAPPRAARLRWISTWTDTPKS